MRLSRDAAAVRRAESGQVIVLILVVLAVIAGGWWLLRSNRDRREKEAWAFANEAARRIVLQQDIRFLDFNLTQKAQMMYPPSWRAQLMHRVREPGTANPEFQIKGNMRFRDHFFEPAGDFIATFAFPTGPAYLELHISHPGALWVIDDLNWTWQPPRPPPPPPPPPAPPIALPSVTPLPQISPSASPRR